MIAMGLVDTLEVAVARDLTRLEDLQQADRLPCSRAALGVAGDRLLRHREQRVADATAQLGRDPVMQIALVRIVGTGRGVVLGHHRDVVGRQAVLGERTTERRVRPTAHDANAPIPGAGIDVWMPSAKLDEYTTTPRTGSPAAAATDARARTSVPPPWLSTNPARRRSLAREN